MIALLSGVVAVPVADQILKALVRRHLGARVLPLGALGAVRLVESRIWSVRARPGLSRRAMWILWIAAAAACAAPALLLPSSRWAVGLLLGAALSHALETSIRGSVCDYVCLRFWPAFNLADVALTAGTVGLIAALVGAVR